MIGSHHSPRAALGRRTLIKGAAGAAAVALAPLSSARAAVTPDRYLWLHGHLAPNPSRKDLTRLYLPTGPVTRFIEFPTKPASFASSNPQPMQLIDVYVPATSNLYFSDDPPPTAADPAALASTPVAFAPVQRRSGLVLSDGSPAALQSGPKGTATGLSGKQAGKALSIALSVSNALLPGRVSNETVTWAACRAAISSGSDPALLFEFFFSPEAYLSLLSLTYRNVRAAVVVDLSPAAGTSGYVSLRRDAEYYKQAFSQQTLRNAAPSALPLVASPVGTSIGRVSAFAPALADVVQKAPSGSPLIQGSLDVGQTETKPQYVSRGAAAVATVLPALASSLCDTPHASLADLGRWLGWAIVEDQTCLANAFGAAFDDFQALKKANPPGSSFKKQPTMKDGGTDELADQILDWVDEKRGG